jgi:hypothetical protein
MGTFDPSDRLQPYGIYDAAQEENSPQDEILSYYLDQLNDMIQSLIADLSSKKITVVGEREILSSLQKVQQSIIKIQDGNTLAINDLFRESIVLNRVFRQFYYGNSDQMNVALHRIIQYLVSLKTKYNNKTIADRTNYQLISDVRRFLNTFPKNHSSQAGNVQNDDYDDIFNNVKRTLMNPEPKEIKRNYVMTLFSGLNYLMQHNDDNVKFLNRLKKSIDLDGVKEFLSPLQLKLLQKFINKI